MSRRPPGKLIPATPANIASFGHIAARLRAYLAESHLQPGDINERMGVKRSNTAIYMWLNAKGKPGPRPAAKLAKMIGISMEQLLLGDAPPPLVEIERRLPIGRPPAIARPAEVLSFSLDAEGNARIRMDIVLPPSQAAPLFRSLLDAGLVMGTRDVEDG